MFKKHAFSSKIRFLRPISGSCYCLACNCVHIAQSAVVVFVDCQHADESSDWCDVMTGATRVDRQWEEVCVCHGGTAGHLPRSAGNQRQRVCISA